MKNTIKIVFILFVVQFSTAQRNSDNYEEYAVQKLLDDWHLAASHANFDAYFLGTDATEKWNKKEFTNYAKPHFDKGKAWNFKKINRSVYFNDSKDVAWFDELLDTQMKICRGSGILQKIDGNWKIKHYVLSISIPNKNVVEIVKLKTVFDDILTKKILKQ